MTASAKRFATRDFNDAGLERSFKSGEEITNVDAGVLDNYEAAGLIGTKAEASAAEDPQAGKKA